MTAVVAFANGLLGIYETGTIEPHKIRQKKLSMTTQEEEAIVELIKAAQEVVQSDLFQVWLFGSAARGDRWQVHQHMRSDIDILVVSHVDVGHEARDRLDSATYPLFLMCGSQISTQFRSKYWLANPPDERAAAFVDRLDSEALGLFPSDIAGLGFRRALAV